MALGQIQLKQLNQAQLSGYVAQVAATGVVIRPEQTGGFIDVAILSNTGDILWNRDQSLSGLLSNATGNININFNNTGQNLWIREEELSSNIAALSGVSNVGTSGQILWNRDLGLGSSINLLSGYLEISGISLRQEINNTGQVLWNRDTNLSTNIAALSGIAVKTSQTGNFLTQSDSGNFITSAIVYSLSGNLVASGGTFNSSGLDLFNRDLGLSNNLASLSGAVAFAANTGDFLDPTDTTSLQSRDTELSNNVSSLSGIVVTTSDTGLFLTQANSGHILLLYLSGKEVAVTETNTLTINGVELAGGGGDLTHASGTLLFDRDTILSNNLADVSGLIGGGGTTINGLDGTVQFTGTGQIFVFADSISKIFVISGSGLGVGDVTTEEIESLSGSLIATGSTLWDRDAELSANLALVSGSAGGWDHASGALLWNRDDSLSGSLVGLSNEVALISGQGGGGGGGTAPIGSTKTVSIFNAAKDFISPATGWANLFYGTGYEYVRFYNGNGYVALYNGIIPEGIDLNFGLNVTLHWHPSNNSTDDVAWVTDFLKLDSIASDNWGTAITTVGSATGNQNAIHRTTAIHSSSQIGDLRSGDAFMLRVIRSGLLGSDTLTDYANLHSIHIQPPVSRTITKTFDKFAAVNFTPPSTGYAQIDWVSGLRTMQLHPDSGEAGMFDSVIPENTDLSNGIRINLHWFPEVDDANDVIFITAFGRRDDLLNDNFGTELSTIGTSTGAGRMHRLSIDHSSAQIGGLVSGDFYRMKVGRSGTEVADDMAGNAHLTYIELETR